MTEFKDYDITSNTGFKTPVLFERFFIVNEKTKKSHFVEHISPYEPIIIGDATNYLFVKESFPSAIKYEGDSITILEESQNSSIIRVEAGRNWHNFVMQSLQLGLFNLENLALIPGTVGAAPVQNIGAYGREVSDSIKTVHCVYISTGEQIQLSAKECSFSYRQSIFKHLEFKNLLITHVDFELSKLENPIANYPDVAIYLEQQNNIHPTPLDIAHAIISIRTKKLPDPSEIGNAGSFFKNPIIDITIYESLVSKYPSLPKYDIDDIHVKVPAGWLIDQSGFKGLRINGAGVHEKQALVLINADNAHGKDIYELALMIQQKVHALFGIMLEPEVNILI